MAEEDTSVVELVTAFRTGRIDLGEVLQRLASRGALPESEYLEGVQTLTRFREEQALDDITISTLVARLGEMRSAHDDATVVSPCVDAGSAGDMTVVAPRAGGPGGTPGRPWACGCGSGSGRRCSPGSCTGRRRRTW